MPPLPLVAILSNRAELIPEYGYSILEAGGSVLEITRGASLPHEASLLVVAGPTEPRVADNATPTPVIEAITRYLPILGIQWGMQVINVAYRGAHYPDTSINSPAVGRVSTEPTKTQMFLSPGGKISHIIGGSGWTSATLSDCGIGMGTVARQLLASGYTNEGQVSTIEQPGHNWVLGISWDVLEPRKLPKGFANILPAIVDYAARRQFGGNGAN